MHLPQLPDLGSKSVEIPETSVRVSLRPRDSGKRCTSVGQRRAACTNKVLQRAFRALHPATAYRFILAIADRDTPAPGPLLPIQASREKRSKPEIATNYLVKIKRLTTRNCDIKCNCNVCIAFLQSASLIGRFLETKQGQRRPDPSHEKE